MNKNEQAVIEYFDQHPKASNGEVAKALNISKSTVAKYKPEKYKTPPLTEEEKEALYRQWLLEKELEEKLSLTTIKQIRDANLWRLHPIDWRRVRAYYAKKGKPMPFSCKSTEEFQELLKEVCDGIYGWQLYEKCPKCGKGIVIPVWHGGQAFPYCECSEYPNCDYSVNHRGEHQGYRTRWQCFHSPIEPSWCYQTETNSKKILCVDVETTGLYADLGDEILQFSIIDGTGAVRFNKLFKPKNKEEWKSAEEINGISPEMVTNKPSIDEYIPQINAIFEEATLIVGYNIDFDLRFIKAAGITIPKDIEKFDVMETFTRIYGDWDGSRRWYKHQKLFVCAAFYGYEGTGTFHDSLEDVRATLFCYYEMTKKEAYF